MNQRISILTTIIALIFTGFITGASLEIENNSSIRENTSSSMIVRYEACGQQATLTVPGGDTLFRRPPCAIENVEIQVDGVSIFSTPEGKKYLKVKYIYNVDNPADPEIELVEVSLEKLKQYKASILMP